MNKKISIWGFVIQLLFITIATVFVFMKGLLLFGFLVCYEIIILTIFIRFRKDFFKTNIYKSFKKLYFKNEYYTIIITFIWIVFDFFIIVGFLLFNYLSSYFVILSIIQIMMDFILTFEIIPSIVDIFKK